MLTQSQINAVAELGAAIAKVNTREDKTLANTKLRYAIERGELKANADPEALRLHGIDIEADEDVRVWRASQASTETHDEPEPAEAPKGERGRKA